MCEGNWTSANVRVGDFVEGVGYTGTVDVHPTTAYANDQNNGKLTIYVPYYGSTAIAQLDLISNGVGYIELQSKEYEGNQTEVSITFLTDEGLNVVGGQYQPLRISANYETSGDDWLSVGKVTRVEKEGKVPIKQIVDMKPYITTSTDAQARKCTLAVFSPSGKEVTRFIVKQNPVIVDPSGYNDLAQNGSANCYIIKNQGKFRMPLRKGNSSEFINGGDFNGISIVRLFTDNEGNLLKVEDLPIEKPEDGGYFYFTVESDANGLSVRNGNTVIAAKLGDTILWSWHLWFNGASSPKDYMDNSNNVIAKVLPNSLGAFSESGNGLYYQWGRKDPFSTAWMKSATGATSAGATAHPENFYSDWSAEMGGWETAKSVNDPCPPGYKVPSSSTWKEYNDDVYKSEFHPDLGIDGAIAYEDYLYHSQLEGASTIRFPYGYIDSNGFTDSKKGFETKQTYNGNVSNAAYVVILGETPSSGDIRYENPTYTLTYDTYYGAFWNAGEAPSGLYYEYVYPKQVVVSAGSWYKYERRFITGSWKKQSGTASLNTTDATWRKRFRHVLPDDIKYVYNREKEFDAANGLQVRCVKE